MWSNSFWANRRSRLLLAQYTMNMYNIRTSSERLGSLHLPFLGLSPRFMAHFMTIVDCTVCCMYMQWPQFCCTFCTQKLQIRPAKKGPSKRSFSEAEEWTGEDEATPHSSLYSPLLYSSLISRAHVMQALAAERVISRVKVSLLFHSPRGLTRDHCNRSLTAWTTRHALKWIPAFFFFFASSSSSCCLLLMPD